MSDRSSFSNEDVIDPIATEEESREDELNETISKVAKKSTQEEKELIATANELLDNLEHIHRTDLTLHLYSSFLLKKLLRRANSRKFPYETDQFIKNKIKENWVSWPNPQTIIDPQTNKLAL